MTYINSRHCHPTEFLLLTSLLVFLLTIKESMTDRVSQLGSQIVEGLGLHVIPDVYKMNVSQQEYEKMIDVYLRRSLVHGSAFSYAKHSHSVKHSSYSADKSELSQELHFTPNITESSEIDTGHIRLLVSADGASPKPWVWLGVYENNRLLDSKNLSSQYLPKWEDLNVKGSGYREFKVVCKGCVIHEPTLNLVSRPLSSRKKREGRTDCYLTAKPHEKPKCCRHHMNVVFNSLPGYQFILQPYSFDAGYCKGSCPYRYNPANHHSSLQSLIWRQKNSGAPKPCCAPSKLYSLEILHLDEEDPTKLRVATWTNMQVSECACY